MLEEISLEKAKQIYKEHIKKDFASNEIKPYWLYKKLLKEKTDKFYIYKEETIEKGYIICSSEKEYVLITHLAVFKEYRGSGIGTKMIQALKNQFLKDKAWIVEVETEKQAHNEEDMINIKRRIHFYEKLGFCKYPEIKYDLFGSSYYIFALYPDNQNILEAKEVADILRKIYNHKKVPEKYLKISLEKQ
ncbi:MAG: GNAT family N-acetyltransferase [Clostridia bacterium]